MDSAAKRFAATSGMSQSSLQQAQSIGQTLHKNGVQHDAGFKQGDATSPMSTPKQGAQDSGSNAAMKSAAVQGGQRPALSPDDANRQAHTKADIGSDKQTQSPQGQSQASQRFSQGGASTGGVSQGGESRGGAGGGGGRSR